MTPLEKIRLIGAEFSDVGDETLEQWIEIVTPMVSEAKFGKLYTTALAYLVCHNMKLAGLGSNPFGEIGVIGAGFGINSMSAGKTSISFGANQSSNLAVDAELALTMYGLRFLQLRRTVIVPITCAGVECGDV